MDHQRLPALALGALRLRRPPRRHRRPPPHGRRSASIVFATASALCGATPTGSLAEAWLIVFRIIQGAGAAIMFPAALAIVLGAFPVRERGRAMAIFFGDRRRPHLDRPDRRRLPDRVDLAGDLLGQRPGRAHRPLPHLESEARRTPGTRRRSTTAARSWSPAAWASLVLGLQQSSDLGLGQRRRPGPASSPALALLAAFVALRARASTNPLLRLRIFEDRAFAVDNAVLFLLMIAFVPLFFFASMYAQISLGESASETGLYLLIFFAGFAIASQWGGKMLDQVGARPPVVLGCAVAAVGFYLWGQSLTDLSVSEQWYYIVIAGIGVGLVLSPANTDALNRVPREPLRRGDRDHPDGAELRLQPRPRGARLAPDPENKSNLEASARRKGVSEGRSRRGRRMRQPGRSGLPKRSPQSAGGEGRQGLRQQCPRTSRWRPGRLLRDGGRDGGRLRRRAEHAGGKVEEGDVPERRAGRRRRLTLYVRAG